MCECEFVIDIALEFCLINNINVNCILNIVTNIVYCNAYSCEY